MRRDSSFCAKSVRYNIFTNGAPYRHTKNDRFKISLPTAEFLCGLWGIILKISISFVYIKLRGVPRAGKVHLKCSNKKLVKANFACMRQKRFDVFIWYQARWCGRSIKTLLTRSTADPRESFQRVVIACQAPETFLSNIFPWKGGELSFHCEACDVVFVICIRNVF